MTRRNSTLRSFVAWTVFAMSWPHAAATADAQPAEAAGTFDAAAIEFFEKQIRPIFARRCHECHGSTVAEPKGGLRLTSRATLLRGGDTGPAVVSREPEKSLLIDAINYRGDYEMPPKSKLPAEEIAALTKWVSLGAPWPKEEAVAALAARKFDLNQRKAEHWCWQPLAVASPPPFKSKEWVRTAIDRFILAKLEEKGLQPAAPADRRTLIRRLSFDLVGLPPAPAEVEAFVSDASPRAIETVVDRLLNSPHFGERWGRHWLDLMRYAESRGHEYDYDAPNAFQYRDYVIRALNADVPYNEIVTEHIAGDLVEKPRLHPAKGFNESILGTGFWYLGDAVHSPVDIRKDETDRFDNAIDVLGKAFLGLTIACARCHDHKFDAISTADYYALAGFLQSSDYRQVRFETMEHNRRIAEELWKLDKEYQARICRAVAKAIEPGLKTMPEYINAARQVMRRGLAKAAGDLKPEMFTAEVDAAAKEFQLDKVQIAGWIEHLLAAKSDISDPFYIWALIALEKEDPSTARIAELARPLLDDSAPNDPSAAAALANATTILNFGYLYRRFVYRVDDAWLPDGEAFGAGPVKGGDIVLGDDPNSPITRVQVFPAAVRDPRFADLKPAPGVAPEPSRYGGAVHAGRTIHTRKFTIKTGLVYSRVVGPGFGYAVVDSHRINSGPLHEALIQKWSAKGRKPQWIAHDLRAYRGHDAHLEFSAMEGEPFELLAVVEADRAPADWQYINGRVQSMVHGAIANNEKLQSSPFSFTLLDMSFDFLWTFSTANEWLAAPSPIGQSDWHLADWLVRHFDLVAPRDPAVRSKVAEAARPYVEARKRLVSQIRRESQQAIAIWDGTGEDEHLLIRGNSNTPGPKIPRRFLEAIAGPNQPLIERGSGRLELARRMTDPKNPLISRVIVNRVWHHLFGRGIVASCDNFGVLGEKPTHPELLDYLAGEFIADGWSLKRLVRRVVLSNTYQVASRPDGQGDEIDPQNFLWHRRAVRRLEGEAIRDAILAVSGRLDRSMYGPSVPIHLTAFQEGRGRPPVGPVDGNGRPSIYLSVRRNFLSPMLLAFDMPIPQSTVGRRNVSNVPAQALILLNDPFVMQQAEIWAKRALAEAQLTTEQRITRLYETAFARPPSLAELASARQFLQTQATSRGNSKSDSNGELRAWTEMCHALLNLKEFVFVN
jgi:mono/diheme cytochrome c family protein/cytochrome c553